MTKITPIASEDAVPASAWAEVADQRAGARWVRWAGPVLSVVILVAVVNALGARDLAELWQMLPRSVTFWALLAALLAIQPVADFLIFRGLWHLPWSGLAALFRKAATNELVFGYTGELQFYIWARRHARMPGSPFGAVRDVAVLSALVGNVVTIVLLGMALATLGSKQLGPLGPHVVWSAIVVIGSSLAIMLFRRHLFALSPHQFRRIAAIHLARAVIVTILFGAMWYLLQPGVAFGWWVVLAAARQFVTRLPFLPNKDLVFAGLAASLLKGAPDMVATVALVATLFAAGHVIIGGTLSVIDLMREASARRRGTR